MAIQDARQCFGPFDSQIDGIVFDGCDGGLRNLGPARQLAPA